MNEATATYPHLVDALGDAMSVYHRGTFEHSARVGLEACAIGRAIGLGAAALEALGWAGVLHDVGKLAVPEGILSKTGPLTPAEWDVVKVHPASGGEMLLAIAPELLGVAEAVRAHHERWDGRGYPDGRRGEEIPLLGRIISLADVYDALTHTRSYRRGSFSALDAQAMIDELAGTQFDPELAPVFLDLLRHTTIADP